MGTYVFRRIEDMFQFFYTEKNRERLYIKPHYWREKIQSDGGKRAVVEFSPKLFKENIRQVFEYHDFSGKEKRDLWACIRHDVFNELWSGGEHDAFTAAMNFEHQKECILYDIHQYDCTEFTYHYIWCCYAIVWGIEQYNLATRGEER